MKHLPQPTTNYYVGRCPIDEGRAQKVDEWATSGTASHLPPVLAAEALGWAWKSWRLVYPDLVLDDDVFEDNHKRSSFEGMMSDLRANQWVCTRLAGLVWRYARRVEAIEVLRGLGDTKTELFEELHTWARGDAAGLYVDEHGHARGWSVPLTQAALSDAVDLVAHIDRARGGRDVVMQAFADARGLVYALDQLSGEDRAVVVDYFNNQLAALNLVVSRGALVRKPPTPRDHPSQAVTEDALLPGDVWACGPLWGRVRMNVHPMAEVLEVGQQVEVNGGMIHPPTDTADGTPSRYQRGELVELVEPSDGTPRTGVVDFDKTASVDAWLAHFQNSAFGVVDLHNPAFAARESLHWGADLPVEGKLGRFSTFPDTEPTTPTEQVFGVLRDSAQHAEDLDRQLADERDAERDAELERPRYLKRPIHPNARALLQAYSPHNPTGPIEVVRDDTPPPVHQLGARDDDTFDDPMVGMQVCEVCRVYADDCICDDDSFDEDGDGFLDDDTIAAIERGAITAEDLGQDVVDAHNSAYIARVRERLADQAEGSKAFDEALARAAQAAHDAGPHPFDHNPLDGLFED